ncbi:MAG: hypothetical protein J5860_05140 [Clostridia bacterium]|nr:hypothetical protein [Clostridia bacterium]MBO4429629.1 hypothetical protein [Clostridia bacterium]
MKSIKTDPLCRGAKRIAYITLPLVALEIAYIILFTKDLGAAELAANAETIFAMLEDTFASVALSLCGVLFFDYCFKRETE